MATVTKNNLFRPVPSKAETKSEITDKSVRAMIESDVKARNAKTARLKEARLAMEAAQPAPAPAEPGTKKTPKRKSRPA